MTFNIVLFLSFADDFLGKPDKHTFSQQALMEIVVSQMSEENQKKFKDDSGDYLKVKDWEGIEMNAEGSVQRITWLGNVVGIKPEDQGTILLEWLPDSVESVDINNRGFEGELECNKLPHNLWLFCATNNRLTGTVDLSELPLPLEFISLSKNKFTGNVNLEKLPKTLTFFYLDGNEFSGDIILRDLPLEIERLYLNDNAFDGKLIVGDLPAALDDIRVKNNFLQKEILFVGADKGYFEERVKETLVKQLGKE